MTCYFLSASRAKSDWFQVIEYGRVLPDDNPVIIETCSVLSIAPCKIAIALAFRQNLLVNKLLVAGLISIADM